MNNKLDVSGVELSNNLLVHVDSRMNNKLDVSGLEISNNLLVHVDSIMNNKLDSLLWLPEALTVIIDKALTDLERNDIYKEEKINRPRLVNHFKNSFSRVSTFDELKDIQDNRTVFIHNTLRPFKVSQKFSTSLSKKMKVHEHPTKQTRPHAGHVHVLPGGPSA